MRSFDDINSDARDDDSFWNASARLLADDGTSLVNASECRAPVQNVSVVQTARIAALTIARSSPSAACWVYRRAPTGTLEHYIPTSAR